MSCLKVIPFKSMQAITRKSVKLHCFCCLSENASLIPTVNCHHYLSYKCLLPAQTSINSYMCPMCHAMLVKIEKFNLMVRQSEVILRNQVKQVDRLHFIKLVTTNASEVIACNHEQEPFQNEKIIDNLDLDNVKDTLTEEFEVKNESSDLDTDIESYEDNVNVTSRFEQTLADDAKISAVQDERAVKVESLNLVTTNQNKVITYNHEQETSLNKKIIDNLDLDNVKDTLTEEFEVKNESSDLDTDIESYEDNVNVTSTFEQTLADDAKVSAVQDERAVKVESLNLVTTNQNKVITYNHEKETSLNKKIIDNLDLDNVKDTLTEQFEVKNESSDTDTCVSDIEDNDDNGNMTLVLEQTLADVAKVSLSDQLTGKVESFNLTPQQLDQERRELASQELFTSSEYKCHDCIRGFTFKYKYQNHMKSKHVQTENYNVLCEICKCYITSRNLKTHMTNHYARWKCLRCGIVKKMKNTIMNHYNGVHEKLFDYKCEECDVVCRTYKALYLHEQKHKNRNGLSYNCEECKRLFLSKYNYDQHMLTKHTIQQILECKHCHKSFKTKKNLGEHIKNAHEDDVTIYSCGLCNQRFYSMYIYKNHKAEHAGSILECDYCGFKHNNKNGLRFHIMTKHLKTGSAVCPKCKKEYCSKKVMERHIKDVHDKIKMPKNKICDYCGKGFALSAILKDHLNTHTGARPYNCKLCSANFKHKAALYTHTRCVHRGEKRKRKMTEK